jgi:hypothetical protein
MMRRNAVIAMAVIMVMSLGALAPLVAAAPVAAPAVSIDIDGLRLVSPAPLQRENDRVLVPFRAISEAIGVDVTWLPDERGIVGTKAADGERAAVEARLWIDRRVATINGAEVALEVPPRLVGDRTFLPARFFAEAFGCQVGWDQAAQRVLITTPERTMTVYGFYALGSSKSSSWTDLFGRPYPDTDPLTGSQRLLSTVGYGWYNIDAAGSLRGDNSLPGWSKPGGWDGVISTADQAGLSGDMVIFADDGQGALATLLANSSAVASLQQAIVSESALYDGVNLDWESIAAHRQAADAATIRAAYAAFVDGLATGLHAVGRQLTVTVPAPNSIFASGYDYARLGAAADRMIVMAYDYYDRGQPSPMAPLASVDTAVGTLMQSVPANKILLGIAPGGVEWRTAPTQSRANPLPATDIASLRQRATLIWDANAGASHFTYQDEAGNNYTVWLEDERAVGLKVALAKRYNLAGVAFWRLGEVPTAVWEAVDAASLPARTAPATPTTAPSLP